MGLSLLASGANESRGELAVADGHFAVTDEEADLARAVVLHVHHKLFVPAKVLLGRQRGVMGARPRGRGGAGKTDGCDGHRARRGGYGTRLLEKTSPTNRFHTPSFSLAQPTVGVNNASDALALTLLPASESCFRSFDVSAEALQSHIRHEESGGCRFLEKILVSPKRP